MQIRYRQEAPGREPLAALVLFFAQDRLELPRDTPAPLRAPVERAMSLQAFAGKSGETATVYPGDGPVERVLLVGLGKPDKVDGEAVRRAAGTAGKTLAGMKVSAAGAWLPAGLDAGRVPEVGLTVAEGVMLGAYRFKTYQAPPEDEPEPPELEAVTLFDPDGASSEEAVRRGGVRGAAVCRARDLGNHPGNVMTPARLADEARDIAGRHGLQCSVLEQADMERLGMGLLLGVARGSRQPPKLIVLEYRAPEARGTLAFVGKGVTFDSGGISLKPGQAMDEMKFDMCGGAAVLGAMDAIGELKPPVNVVGLVPASENLPDGQATKPGDILRAYSGKHVEILNTDAEGRLLLADALAYGIAEHKPDAVVDLATLTGACVIALGHYATGAISNDEGFQEQVVGAGRRSGDVVWPLPGFAEYEEGLKGKYGDLQNIAGRDAGTITGGLFLKNFVGEVPWVHLDIAGTAWGVKNIGHVPNEGATGVGVRLLVELAEQWRR